MIADPTIFRDMLKPSLDCFDTIAKSASGVVDRVRKKAHGSHMVNLYPIVFATAVLLSGCVHNDSEALPFANSNLHKIKAKPAVTKPKPTRSFWNWFGDGLTHATVRTYRDRKWINSRDRMIIDEVGYEREEIGGCGSTGCNTKTNINRR